MDDKKLVIKIDGLDLVARREQEQEKRRAHDLQMQLQEKVRQFQKLQVGRMIKVGLFKH